MTDVPLRSAGSARGGRTFGARFDRLRAVRYLVVGGISALADIAALVLLREIAGIALGVAAGLAWAVGVAVNYALSARITFRARMSGCSARRYLLLLLTNVVVTVVAVEGLAVLGVPYLVTKAVALGLLALLNYVAYARWVFSPSGQPGQTS